MAPYRARLAYVRHMVQFIFGKASRLLFSVMPFYKTGRQKFAKLVAWQCLIMSIWSTLTAWRAHLHCKCICPPIPPRRCGARQQVRFILVPCQKEERASLIKHLPLDCYYACHPNRSWRTQPKHWSDGKPAIWCVWWRIYRTNRVGCRGNQWYPRALYWLTLYHCPKKCESRLPTWLVLSLICTRLPKISVRDFWKCLSAP